MALKVLALITPFLAQIAGFLHERGVFNHLISGYLPINALPKIVAEPTTTGAPKRTRFVNTPEEISFIVSTWRKWNSLPRSARPSQLELVKELNTVLGRNASRTTYRAVWNEFKEAPIA